MMFNRLKTGLQLGAALAVLGTAATAHAGACPAGSLKPNARTTGEMTPKGVTDDVLGAVVLDKEAVKLDGRKLRIRKLVIQPGGVVPWHSHADRPALIMTLEGSITEYASNCSAPIEHPAGDVAQESMGVSHWWKNNTTKPVTLISADIMDARPANAGKPDHM
jgi:quercetin dioxygenase-like cupin family protein